MKVDKSPATKSDVEEIVGRVVTKVVGEAKTEILSAVGDQFDIVNDHLDGMENQLDIIQTDSAHARSISQATSDRVDRHEKRLKHLEIKAKVS